MLARTGCRLVVSGRHERKLALLREAGIATAPAEELATASFGLAVECTGSAAGFALARRSLRPRGTLVRKSTYAGELNVDASSIVVDEITLVGSRCGPFAPALQMLAEGTVDPRPLIDGLLRRRVVTARTPHHGHHHASHRNHMPPWSHLHV